MNKVKESLKENMEEILKSLPSELHDGFKKDLDGLSDTVEAPLTGDAQISAIKAELVANPAVDENAAAAELSDIKPVETIAPLTEAESAAEEAKNLAEHKK